MCGCEGKIAPTMSWYVTMEVELPFKIPDEMKKFISLPPQRATLHLGLYAAALESRCCKDNRPVYFTRLLVHLPSATLCSRQPILWLRIIQYHSQSETAFCSGEILWQSYQKSRYAARTSCCPSGCKTRNATGIEVMLPRQFNILKQLGVNKEHSIRQTDHFLCSTSIRRRHRMKL